MTKLVCASLAILLFFPLNSQDYFLDPYSPYNEVIPTPEEFLGYPVGSHHTRHDRIVSYFETLAHISDRAALTRYGETYEHRPLIILTITKEEHLTSMDQLQREHLRYLNPEEEKSNLPDIPIFVNLGYNVHGNEPSGAEAALLTAYILVASESDVVRRYREEGVYFIDPVINPDGRDRHSQWVNMFKGDPLVSDPLDVEHNEGWPRGRTNHYWFDLNRDWWLAIHPESRGKLRWYHQWYPNVVTDFHEMGTNSTYFFEPMKTNASLNPVMPAENYTTLNDTFATYFVQGFDDIGSLYFTKEVFDGTYPGYGSSYPDLQGGLGLLFEQASARGHVQKTPGGDLTFAFAIKNQLTSAMATVKASVIHRQMLYDYQHEFFKSALENARKDEIKTYVFGDSHDRGRTKAFIDKLLIHGIQVFRLNQDIELNTQVFKKGIDFAVPTNQKQYRMIQNVFETYEDYADSVFYDASAWSLVNFYNMPHAGVETSLDLGSQIQYPEDLTIQEAQAEAADYAYIIPWTEYSSPAVLSELLRNDVVVHCAFKPFSIQLDESSKSFGYGTMVIPVHKQKLDSNYLHNIILSASTQFEVPVYPVSTGYSIEGVDLGSRHLVVIEKPQALMLIGNGVSAYEAGEVWHLLDQRVRMPITKVSTNEIDRIDWSKYKTLILVSGSYAPVDSSQCQVIKNWLSAGNTLITTRQASSWAISKKLVKEEIYKSEDKDSTNDRRRSYIKSSEELGRERVGGAIFEVDIDLTHPVAFGYTRSKLPVYRNSEVWLNKSKNAYSTVAKYSDDPHIDGFISDRNLNTYLKPSASIIVSKVGKGRVIMFAENPNFRGSWYGTNRLFLNGLFFGKHIQVPE